MSNQEDNIVAIIRLIITLIDKATIIYFRFKKSKK